MDKYDRLVTWRRPQRHSRPRGISVEQWSLLPKQVHVRLLRFGVNIPGFRSRRIMVATLIRCMMWQAAESHGKNLHRLSFAGSVDRFNSMTPYLWLYEGSEKAHRLYELLLSRIAHDPNPDRPNRIEPRAVKRRPKPYSLMNKPRREMRKALL